MSKKTHYRDSKNIVINPFLNDMLLVIISPTESLAAPVLCRSLIGSNRYEDLFIFRTQITNTALEY